MKRFLVVLSLILAAGGAFAVDIVEVPFVPVVPGVMGQGGSATATAYGWSSFFDNPAGFSRDLGSSTIFSSAEWLYARPDRVLDLVLTAVGLGTADVFGIINSEITGGGFGDGGYIGVGYAANGLGLGLAIVADSYFWGPTLLGMSGDVTLTVGFMGGLAYPFALGGANLHVGALLRPMIRVHLPMPNADAIAMFAALQAGSDLLTSFGSATAVYGVGIGIDLGAIAEIGWFTIGVSIRDLGGTEFNYSSEAFSTLLSTFQTQMALPPGSPVSDRYVIPMDVSAGVSFHPSLGGVSKFIDPVVHFGVRDAVNLVGEIIAGDASVWKLFHLGAELRLLSFLTGWAGLDQGYFTFGAGMHLLFLDINAAVFTRELGRYIGDRPSSGTTIEVAFRL